MEKLYWFSTIGKWYDNNSNWRMSEDFSWQIRVVIFLPSALLSFRKVALCAKKKEQGREFVTQNSNLTSQICQKQTQNTLPLGNDEIINIFPQKLPTKIRFRSTFQMKKKNTLRVRAWVSGFSSRYFCLVDFRASEYHRHQRPERERESVREQHSFRHKGLRWKGSALLAYLDGDGGVRGGLFSEFFLLSETNDWLACRLTTRHTVEEKKSAKTFIIKYPKNKFSTLA